MTLTRHVSAAGVGASTGALRRARDIPKRRIPVAGPAAACGQRLLPGRNRSAGGSTGDGIECRGGVQTLRASEEWLRWIALKRGAEATRLARQRLEIISVQPIP